VVEEFKESRDETVFSLPWLMLFLQSLAFLSFTVVSGLVLHSGVPLLSVKCF